MIALLLLACAEPVSSGPPDAPAICNCAPAPSTDVTETFLVVPEPVDLLVAADPALMPDVIGALPDLLLGLVEDGLDARVGVVSTALGEPGLAGQLLPLTHRGWWTPDDALEPLEDPVPAEPPLGGLGAATLALDGAREGAAVRVLVAQEADDATPSELVTLPEWTTWFAGLGDVGMVVRAPEEAPRLDAASEPFSEGRYTPQDELAAAVDGLYASLPGLVPRYTIAGRPVPETLVVQVEDVSGAMLPPFEQGVDYVYDERTNGVTFLEFRPAPFSTVLVSYAPLE